MIFIFRGREQTNQFDVFTKLVKTGIWRPSAHSSHLKLDSKLLMGQLCFSVVGKLDQQLILITLANHSASIVATKGQK